MALINGAAIYKKKTGLLLVFDTTNPPKLRWVGADQSKPGLLVEVVLRAGTKLQASPPQLEKMALRIISTGSDGETQKTDFLFTNRLIMNNIKEAIRQLIEMQEMAKTSQPIAAPVTAPRDTIEEMLDPKKLLANWELQEKLLASDPALQAVFRATVINGGLDAKEFWKTRLHLLGTFALESQAKRGPYNVLSTINIVAGSDNKFDLNVTREKIQFLFDQFPIVRKAYEDNVPGVLPESMFWSRFFALKLFRKLRGERVNKNEKSDNVFDAYLNVTDEEMDRLDELDRLRKKNGDADKNVSRFLDLEGNEEDNPQKLGNKPDFTMQPEKDREMVLIMRGFNRISRKLVENVEEEHVAKKQRVEEEVEEILYEDLEETKGAEYVKLSVPESKITSGRRQKTSKIDVTQLVLLVEEMKQFFPPSSVELSQVYENKEAIESANLDVTKHIYTISSQPKQNWQLLAIQEGVVDIGKQEGPRDQVPLEKLKIPKLAVENLRLVHITSVEFLKHFWLHFNSGDPSQATTTRKLFISVKKSFQRMVSVLKEIQASAPEDKKLDYEQYAKALMRPLKESFARAIEKYDMAEAQSSVN